MANVFILLGAYAVGAGAWSLLSAARWIAMLSHDDMLSIQPGHSDGCCGLKGIGDCCLQSAVPLLIGMVLCLAWINGPHLRFFQSAEKRSRVQKKGLSACPNTQRDPVQERQQENDVPTFRYELLDASAEKWYLQPKASYLSDIFAHNVLPLVTPTSSPPPQSPTR